MPDLISQTLHIGSDAYGRRVTMTRAKTYDGKIVWTIVSDPVNQRDDGERMTGLSDENVRQMAQALAIASPGREEVSPSDPLVIINGIRQFGLAADGSDLRDLEVAIRALTGADSNA